jgi:hypothetical protein
MWQRVRRLHRHMAIQVSMRRKNDCFGNIVRNTTMKWIWFDNFEMDKHLIRLIMTTTTMMMTPVTMLMVNEEAWGQKTSVSTDESNYTPIFMRLYMPPFFW